MFVSFTRLTCSSLHVSLDIDRLRKNGWLIFHQSLVEVSSAQIRFKTIGGPWANFKIYLGFMNIL